MVTSDEMLDKLSAYYSLLPYEQCSIESRDDSIKLSLLFSQDTIVIITAPIIPIEDMNENEVVFSVFINRKLMVCDVMEISSLFDQINDLVTPPTQ